MSQFFNDLLLSPHTLSQLTAFIDKPANALLISGRAGSGKSTLTKHLAAVLMGIQPDKVLAHPQVIFVTKPEGKTEIPIESVRAINSKMSLRVASNDRGHINRVAVFEDAQALSTEAQNALLKLLEQPPAKTLLVLITDSDDNLLPTVVSRTQKIYITPPSLDQAISFFTDQSQQSVESAYRLSQGASELLGALLADQDSHSLKIGVAQAKAFVTSDVYQRIIQLQQISKDKVVFASFLDALARVLAALHEENLKNGRQATAKRILSTRKTVEDALYQIEYSSNIRLTSLALAINTKI